MRLTFGDVLIRIFVALVFTTIVCMLIACIGLGVSNEKNRIAEGTVIDKEYTAAYITYTSVNNTMIPNYHPAIYSVCIAGEKDVEYVEYWLNCTENEYENYKIGDHFSR